MGEMQAQERDIHVIVDGYTREWTFKQHPHLSLSQHRAVEDVLESRDKMMALEGVTGAGKMTSLTAIRDAVEHHGYEVRGLAPTSRAAQKLAETGMKTETLQRHLARSPQSEDGPARVYVVDEASMVSTRQMHAFLERLNRYDRVLFVGDVRQHKAVEAGRPYAQMQEVGLRTARLDEILRQKDPVPKETVEQLARGEVKQAIENLSWQGRIHEFKDRGERMKEIAREYARLPEKTLVISPDNQSRQEINRHIHRAMREAGHVAGADHRVPVLHARQELTGADRQHAQNYEPGNVVRYSKGSKPLGIAPGEYARGACGCREQHRDHHAEERRGTELRPAPVAGSDGLSRRGAQLRRGRPRANDISLSSRAAGQSRVGNDPENRQRRQPETEDGLGPRG